MNLEKLSLKLVESKQSLRNKNLVLVSSEDMKKLGLSTGDFVLVGNNKKIVFRVIREQDNFLGNLGMDGLSRNSLDLSLGENVEIYPIKSFEKVSSFELSILEDPEIPSEQIEQNLIPYLRKKENKLALLSQFSSGVVSLGQKIKINSSLGPVTLEVTKILPKKVTFGKISDNAKLEISGIVGKGTGANVHYEDIGGLDEEISKIREMVEFPMKHPKIFEKLGVGAPKGVLLTGPPGTGKTLLAKAVATETDAKFISIAGPEIMSKYHGGSEENLRSRFEEAQKNSPAIVFIDEIDAIAPKRGESHDQAEKRVVTQLLTLMDGLNSRGQVVVMAATNRPDDLDEALRRPGRFDRELRINPPSEIGRKKILEIHTRNMPIENREEILSEFSNKTMGYTGADLEVLCKEAALHSVKPFYSELMSLSEEMESKGVEETELKEGIESNNEEERELIRKRDNLLKELIVKRSDFVYAMKMVEPSAMREVLIKKPNVKWSDVGGLKEAKEKLRELVELPLLRPELYAAAGIKPSKGVLLYGPPGTGKTLLAKAVATEANANFISIKGPELISKWVGESEKHVREIFKKAKQVSPSIIFFDEFDSISKSRGSGMGNDSSEKVVNQLLTELDGIEDLENVMVIAATNRKDLIDAALLRPGRIDSHVELGLPDLETREQIFNVHIKNMPLEKDVDIKKMSKDSSGWTGADIEAVCRNAGINAIKKNYKEKDVKKLKITKEDFDFALKEVSEQNDKPLLKEGEKKMSSKEVLDKIGDIKKNSPVKNKVSKSKKSIGDKSKFKKK